MANKQLVFENAARDLTTGQFFDLILIDGGGTYNLYVRDKLQPPTQPANVAQITSAGATPVIAPAGAGNVTGIGTTGNLIQWTDGPNSVIGDSVLTQVAGSILQPTGNFTLSAGNVVLTNGTIAQAFVPIAANPTAVSFAITPTTNVTNVTGLSVSCTANANQNAVIASLLSVTVGAGFTIAAGGTQSIFAQVFNSGTITGTSRVGRFSLTNVGSVAQFNILQSIFFNSGTGADVRGLFIGGWTVGAGVTNLDGILIDATVTGAVSTFAIRSLSTAPSLLTGTLTISALTANAFLYSGVAGLLTTTAAPTDGQLLIGSTGAAPVLGSLASADATILITAGAGTIDLSLAGTKVFLISQSATPLNLTAAQSQITYTNEGAAAPIVVNLPTAAAGLTFEFIVQDVDGFVITAAAGDTIQVASAVSSVAGTATSVTIGSVLRLVAINATEWVAVSIVGVWVTA